jgi:TonB-dependent SusC/RagA subfamily outer membrane receptor
MFKPGSYLACGVICVLVAACAGSSQAGEEHGPVTAGDISDRSHYESVVEMLRGKAPGLEIVENSAGSIEVRIRGMTQSLREDMQEPLVVIDGVPSGRPAGQVLLSLEPRNVASIEVLRDVSSTAVWGTRGANGVILITSTRG